HIKQLENKYEQAADNFKIKSRELEGQVEAAKRTSDKTISDLEEHAQKERDLVEAEKELLAVRIKQLEEEQKQAAADLDKNSFKLEGQAETAKKASERRIKSLEEQAQRERDFMKAEKERLSEHIKQLENKYEQAADNFKIKSRELEGQVEAAKRTSDKTISDLEEHAQKERDLVEAEKELLAVRIKQLEEEQKQAAADLDKNSSKLEGQAQAAKKASEKRIKTLEEQAQKERDSMKAEKERLSEHIKQLEDKYEQAADTSDKVCWLGIYEFSSDTPAQTISGLEDRAQKERELWKTEKELLSMVRRRSIWRSHPSNPIQRIKKLDEEQNQARNRAAELEKSANEHKVSVQDAHQRAEAEKTAIFEVCHCITYDPSAQEQTRQREQRYKADSDSQKSQIIGLNATINQLRQAKQTSDEEATRITKDTEAVLTRVQELEAQMEADDEKNSHLAQVELELEIAKKRLEASKTTIDELRLSKETLQHKFDMLERQQRETNSGIDADVEMDDDDFQGPNDLSPRQRGKLPQQPAGFYEPMGRYTRGSMPPPGRTLGELFSRGSVPPQGSPTMPPQASPPPPENSWSPPPSPPPQSPGHHRSIPPLSSHSSGAAPQHNTNTYHRTSGPSPSSHAPSAAPQDLPRASNSSSSQAPVGNSSPHPSGSPMPENGHSETNDILRDILCRLDRIEKKADASPTRRAKGKFTGNFATTPTPRPRMVERTDLTKVVHDELGKYLNIKKDYDIVARFNDVSIDRLTVENFDEHAEVPPFLPLRLWFDQPSHEYNLAMAVIFATEVLKKHPDFIRDDIERQFIARILVLRRHLRLGVPREGETDEQRQARIDKRRNEENVVKRRRGRKIALVDDRTATCGNQLFEKDSNKTLWKNLLSLLNETPASLMSSDESDGSSYTVIVKPWRDDKLTEIFKFIDQHRPTTNGFGGNRPGNPFRTRIRHNGARESKIQATAELPQNFYKPTWLLSLKAHEERLLNAKQDFPLPVLPVRDDY
ncbi:hypothetical protein DXG01_006477, partial [Tephrocybe rancida]